MELDGTIKVTNGAIDYQVEQETGKLKNGEIGK
jgi:hypothetical protein